MFSMFCGFPCARQREREIERGNRIWMSSFVCGMPQGAAQTALSSSSNNIALLSLCNIIIIILHITLVSFCFMVIHAACSIKILYLLPDTFIINIFSWVATLCSDLKAKGANSGRGTDRARQTNRQGRQTSRQTNRRTDSQSNRWTDRQCRPAVQAAGPSWGCAGNGDKVKIEYCSNALSQHSHSHLTLEMDRQREQEIYRERESRRRDRAVEERQRKLREDVHVHVGKTTARIHQVCLWL